jgi:uncharacterized protein YgiM (DUF1202 family)
MKRCPKCGQIYADSDGFCDSCGTPLIMANPHNPADRIQNQPGKKSPVPIILGCVAAAVILIAGTVICVKLIERKSEATETASGESISDTQKNSKKSRLTAAGGEEDFTASGVENSDAWEAPEVKEEVPEAKEEVPEVTEEVPEEASQTKEQAAVPQNSSADSDITYETYYVVNCKESITLRKSASTSAAEICQIPFGSAVSYVETAKNGFYKIIYNGKTGYGLAAYLDVTPQSQPQPASSGSSPSGMLVEVVNCRESITLRKTPDTSGEEICQIPLGAAVEFLDTSENGFYMVSYEGHTGYALASYLAPW